MSACTSLALVSAPLYAEQGCNTTQIQSTPTERFIASEDDSEVFDKKTQLVWKRCGLGFVVDNGACVADANSSNASGKWNWLDVTRKELAKISAYGDAGSKADDWRLPNIKELASITEYSCTSPALNTEVFYDAPESGFYVSNSVNVDKNMGLKAVKIATGEVVNRGKTDGSYYRIVRVPSSDEIAGFLAEPVDLGDTLAE